ncbi:hypothetical protein DL240_05365 [Lujinxingia litoralis]|uniref:Calcineurin-like phosphoesterase domain-containing protein n=1 Tax=Lujinxingia litoralis TaxID=2211119 RepID=A0A328CAQ1_9DELT|nr:metallophosphoesterase [Lujinxingia litoralis]RAL23589.1 hypothetical protein DL240_05365 [Lujinxingia litoralis]
MRIGHISDLHILAIDRIRPWEYLNKRMVGGLNLLLNRSKAHSTSVVERALEALDSLNVDHIVISGDLTNLALDSEFAAAAEIIRSIESAFSRVSVVPGNHDYYTPGAASSGRFERHFKEYLKSDLPEYQLERGYPFCHLREDVAIIGLNSGIATPWLFATGRVDDDELEQAARMLDDERLKSRFKIVVVHHPLMADEHHRFNFNRRMINAESVLTTLRQKNVDLILHGHNHYLSVLQVPKLGEAGTTFVCEAGSTSVEGGGPKMAGKFNIYTIDDSQLVEIETHLFESHASGFRPFRSEVFRRHIEEERG